MIFHAGIKKVVYKNEYKDKEGINLLKRKGVEVVSFNDLVNSDSKIKQKKRPGWK
ncbi:hypothetical protein [Caminibacter mediatlanticus]|uniref:Uncharacterized protein n=1 Tax=Caminibacter mediatlanticus TB-2 TaxID=391592 RepID=A0AAI9AFY2_9BACT|nr:hypothetical protein [Caminibacter mediatlanticus]EDM22943.1 hypothetical protein CMTB2_05542 [Caminibacter mediatlanticus TB-2]